MKFFISELNKISFPKFFARLYAFAQNKKFRLSQGNPKDSRNFTVVSYYKQFMAGLLTLVYLFLRLPVSSGICKNKTITVMGPFRIFT
jgi:hypothetical protein